MIRLFAHTSRVYLPAGRQSIVLLGALIGWGVCGAFLFGLPQGEVVGEELAIQRNAQAAWLNIWLWALLPLTGAYVLWGNQATAAARQQTRFQNLLNRRQAMLVLVNRARATIVHANPPAAEFYGLAAGQLPGLLLHNLEADPPQTIDAPHLPSTNDVWLTRHQSADGRVRDVEIMSSLVVLGNETLECWMIRDISVQKATEQRLAVQVAAVQVAALEAAANSVVITNVDGVIQWVNPAFTRLTGYRAEEVIGQNPRILKSGLNSPEFYRAMWKTITAGHIYHSEEVVNRRKDGNLYAEQLTITPVANQQGVITNFIAIKLDISERKRAQIESQAERDFARTVMESVGDGLAVVSQSGRLEYANTSLLTLLGVDSSAALGQPIGQVDVQMPEMDGFEATLAIRRTLHRARQPQIIATTAHAMQGDRGACLRSGMDDYISKPMRVETLVFALERASQPLRERTPDPNLVPTQPDRPTRSEAMQSESV